MVCFFTKSSQEDTHGTGLSVSYTHLIVDYAQRLIFVCQLLQRLGNLIDIRLVNRFIALCSIRLGIFGLRISNRICLGGKRITGLCAGQLCKCAEVAGMQLAHFDRFVACLLYTSQDRRALPVPDRLFVYNLWKGC